MRHNKISLIVFRVFFVINIIVSEIKITRRKNMRKNEQKDQFLVKKCNGIIMMINNHKLLRCNCNLNIL